MYLSVHILCMNDCTLPVHLNSILHITSTLIWATKCAVCLCTFSSLTAINNSYNSTCHQPQPCCYSDEQRILFSLETNKQKKFPKDDQPCAMTAIDGDVLLLIFTHLLSSIKLL